MVQQHTPSGDRVLTEEEADLVTYCLRKVVLERHGHARRTSASPAAGKTGTTQDNRDAWFVGYTPKLTAAVWMGYVGAPGAEVRFMVDVHGIAVTGGSLPRRDLGEVHARRHERDGHRHLPGPHPVPRPRLNPDARAADVVHELDVVLVDDRHDRGGRELHDDRGGRPLHDQRADHDADDGPDHDDHEPAHHPGPGRPRQLTSTTRARPGQVVGASASWWG